MTVAPGFEAKICAPAELPARLAALPRPLVFTNGCFDILHRGHVTYLAQARALGASLLVAVNTDASVRRLGKGQDRPINSQGDRMAVLAALECVSLVTWFDDDTPIARILESQPDILVKGGDWPVEQDRRQPRSARPGWPGAFHPLHAPALDHRAGGQDQAPVAVRLATVSRTRSMWLRRV